ncbi:multicopper oxidase domain-containing protein [Phytomonospora sp. NPDC050363]|uniref:multicopper oxidase family protein n=1 Tax=Phytomonospora sp. NPDC050363 TaxID=3155642 RepID=UPI0033EE510A
MTTPAPVPVPAARPVKRRRLLKTALIAVPAVVVAGAGAAGIVWANSVTDTTGEVDFKNPLAVPPLAQSTVDGEGRRVFELTLQSGQRQFKDGAATGTWGFNGDYLGPTIRATRGETVLFNIHNTLGETTSVHWHGMHLPPTADGGPHQSVHAGNTWSPSWKIEQQAASLWYHPHPHGETFLHVYRGLAGMFLIDDEESAALALPKDYGLDDFPLIVQDRTFDGDNQFDESQGLIANVGYLGDEILVNGTHSPYLDVTTTRVRLRILNGSGSRAFNFGFADDRTFALIGTDGGLRDVPYGTDRIQLSPAERAEIVVEMTPGEKVVLRSYPAEGLGMDLFSSRFDGCDDSFDVLELRAAATLAESPAVPAELVEIPELDADKSAETRDFQISGFTLNGEAMDMERIDFAVRKDSVEIWELENFDSQFHNFHVHDVQFQVLKVNGKKPPEHLRGWKDTVHVKPGGKTRIIMQFKDFADPDMPYMCHCHVLYHEDQGLMGQFVVLDKGQKVGKPPKDGHVGH